VNASRAGVVAGGLSVVILCGLAARSADAGPPLVPTPIGVTRRYRLPATSPAVRSASAVGSLACSQTSPARFRVHVELFARRLVLIVPAGIGVAPPVVRDGAYIVGGHCLYPLRTREPTGVVEVASPSTPRLGDLFRVWGQPLGRRRLAGFRDSKPLLAFVNGRRFHGDPRAIPLRRHDEIVLEIGGYVPPHTAYLFPKGRP
jgi:hypothetical protein